MESIHDLKKTLYRNWYGSTKKTYRRVDLDKIMMMHESFMYLLELHTRTRLVPCNEEFRTKKAIPHFNSQLKRMQELYPNIKEFFNLKLITT